MRIIQFVHPDFLNSQSMPRFARMISNGMHSRGHAVDTWSAKPMAYRLPAPVWLKKWLGYIDQFILFPLQARWRLRKIPIDTLFVFSDQALGPWVPIVSNRPHVIHVHDFMALRSALGEIAQNPTSWTGRQYQYFIRRGFRCGRNFISVSENTQKELHRFLPSRPDVSEVIYNGLNFHYYRMRSEEALVQLLSIELELPAEGFLLHVGGNQWYKNREGIIEIYLAYATQTDNPLPLWMIGAPPTERMRELANSVSGTVNIRFLSGLSNEQLCAAYSSARLLLFPSLAEGFGWPIAEAMACGCLVLTTNEAPMTEVGGGAAFYIPVRDTCNPKSWANHAARRISEILNLDPDEVKVQQQKAYGQVQKFETELTLDAYEHIYQQVVARGAN